MRRRCPRAKPISFSAISGWRFRINTRGFATVAPEDGATAYGLVWRIDAADERSLDRYEGVADGFYSKRTIEVRIAGARPAEAFLYVANDDQPGVPRPEYMKAIIRAAESAPFPKSYLAELRKWIIQ